MGPVREHMDHHDDPGALPVLTESARVEEVTAMDNNRNDEVHRAAAGVLEALDRSDLVGGSDPPRVAWDAVEAFLERAGDGPLLERLEHLTERFRRPFPSVCSITLREDEERIEFVPGQYVTIRFHDTPRPYSLANSPNGDGLEFCVRRVPGGRLTSDLFEQLDPGDAVTVRGPNGEFVMEEPSTRDLAFLATGTGVAPLRSMIRYTFEEGRDVHAGTTRDVWLFLGCSWRDDLPYREEFHALAAARENFHFVPCLTRETYLTDWDGETAYVQRTLPKYLADDVAADVPDAFADTLAGKPATGIDARIDPASLEVYACGVSAMVETLVDAVRRVGVPAAHVHGEGYG